MVPTWITKSALLALGCAALLAGQTARAVSIDLVDNTGAPAGWRVTIPDDIAADVNLTFQRSSGNQFFFTKTATIRNNSDPIIMTFDRTSATAKDLVIANESITNASGADWTGFRTFLSSGSVSGTPNFALTTSDGSAGIGNFAIDPFTTFQFVSNNTELFLSGGTVVNGSVWNPGSTSSTGLAIVTNNATSTHFALKEMPISGPGVIIPVPTAAWAGLSTMLGLCLVSAGRKAYHRLF
jgi:hypothetical protein